MTNPYGQQPPGPQGQQVYGPPSGGMPMAPQGQPLQGQPPQQFYGQQPYGQPPQPYGQQPYGAPGMAGPMGGQDIPDYKGWAIGTIFLFWILAIFAIMKSNEVNTYKAQGNLVAAQEASRQTRTMCLIATIVGAAWILFTLLWIIIAAVTVSSVPTYY